ncbi:hypothetical protein RPO35_04240 [Staphylococcus hominis]|uniref:hypothetical protein n=1 Tax=Staphylococcus TaxID=1279 RepID=UPI00066AC1E6|nr:hypothetical protein [Staphylococcus hominis]AUJ52350.1 hypothetical protein B7P03_06845 [Staphylococcus hominis subsp. hominis]AYY66257.1 hypothetical protein EGX58_04780 [Staphylococcus hominis]MCE4990182.1 hypothetical protein [Staphylococcus hominis]MCI2914895.1 hypothetical protein [Staphylococcus hominis]MDO0981209.1 hypothetical protein [Staphylococcus hominis]
MRDFLKLLGALLTVIITFSISILFSFLIPLMVEGNILNMGKLNQPTFIMLWIIFSVIFNIIILILAFSLIQFSSDFVNKMKLIATLTFFVIISYACFSHIDMQGLTDHLTLTSSKHAREVSIKLLPFILTISLGCYSAILSYLQHQIDKEERNI